MEPVWAPLERLLGKGRCVGFMFMGRTNGTINRYKHGITRTYLNLDDEGNCYVPGNGGTYVQADWDAELAKLGLPGNARLKPDHTIRRGLRC